MEIPSALLALLEAGVAAPTSGGDARPIGPIDFEALLAAVSAPIGDRAALEEDVDPEAATTEAPDGLAPALDLAGAREAAPTVLGVGTAVEAGAPTTPAQIAAGTAAAAREAPAAAAAKAPVVTEARRGPGRAAPPPPTVIANAAVEPAAPETPGVVSGGVPVERATAATVAEQPTGVSAASERAGDPSGPTPRPLAPPAAGSPDADGLPDASLSRSQPPLGLSDAGGTASGRVGTRLPVAATVPRPDGPTVGATAGARAVRAAVGAGQGVPVERTPAEPAAPATDGDPGDAAEGSPTPLATRARSDGSAREPAGVVAARPTARPADVASPEADDGVKVPAGKPSDPTAPESVAGAEARGRVALPARPEASARPETAAAPSEAQRTLSAARVTPRLDVGGDETGDRPTGDHTGTSQGFDSDPGTRGALGALRPAPGVEVPRDASGLPAMRPDQAAQVERLLRMDALRRASGRPGGELRLEVEPEGLGSVEMRIAVRADAVHATLYAQQDLAREALAAHRLVLEAALDRADLRLEGFSVGSQDGDRGAHHDTMANQGSRAGAGPRAETPAVPTAVVPRPERARGGTGLSLHA